MALRRQQDSPSTVRLWSAHPCPARWAILETCPLSKPGAPHTGSDAGLPDPCGNVSSCCHPQVTISNLSSGTPPSPTSFSLPPTLNEDLSVCCCLGWGWGRLEATAGQRPESQALAVPPACQGPSEATWACKPQAKLPLVTEVLALTLTDTHAQAVPSQLIRLTPAATGTLARHTQPAVTRQVH